MKMKGKAVYAGPTNKDPLFRLIVFEDRGVYAAEVVSLSNRYFESPDWMPGDSGHALFLITEDEFNLKDTDEKKLEEFIFELYTKIPEDRLMESFFISIDNDSRRDMNLKPKCKTVDDNKIERQSRRQYAQNHGIPYLNSVEKVYMIYDTVTGDSCPSITWNGYANVFTKFEYAEDFLKQSEIKTLGIKEYAKTDFEAQVKSWYALGIQSFYLNAGTNEHPSAILRDDYLPDPKAKEWEYSGSALYMCIIRYLQYSAQKSENMRSLSKTLYSAFCHELKETFLLCPFLYESDNAPLDEEDYVLHTSAEAGEKALVKKDSLKFYGGEKYGFSSLANLSETGEMHIIMSENGNEKCIPAFTDFASLKAAYGENVRIGLYTYDELRAIAEKDEGVSGIIINPGPASMPVPKEDMQRIEKISKEEQKIYVPERVKEDAVTTEDDVPQEITREIKDTEKPEKKGVRKSAVIAAAVAALLLLGVLSGILYYNKNKDKSNGDGTENAVKSIEAPETQTPAPLTEDEKKEIEENRQQMQDALADEDAKAVAEIKNLDVVYVVYDGNAGVSTPYLRDGKTLEITGEGDYPPDYNEEQQTWTIATYGYTQEEFAEYLKTAKANGAERVKYMTFDAKKTENTGVYSYNGSTVSIDSLLKE
ncbi:MAG: SseB family protein [Clostridia bacterium]|nr:SseB family protein [Clostridia bacterium]